MTGGAARVMRRCDELASFSEEPGRITRRFASNAMHGANTLLADWMRAAGMRVRQDHVGNLIGRYEATRPDAPSLLLGSHLDTVRDAGRYDGPLGVLAALACVEQLHASGRRLPFAIEVPAFADEEGLRYHTAYLGSAGFVGAFDPALLVLVDTDGITLAEAIRCFGGDPARACVERSAPERLLGYVEVHIEQGPVLEAEGLPVGVVTAIAAQSRFALELRGTAGHAGTVPMALRRDALAAASELVLAAEMLAQATPGLVATVGQIAAEPGASNVIPGRATLSLDVRHHDDATLERAQGRLRAQAAQIAARRRIELRWETVQQHAAVPMDTALTKTLAQAVQACGYQLLHLPSGAGHDAVELAHITRTAMLFVRCAGGVSHNPAESVQEADVAVAIEVLGQFVELLVADYVDD